MKIAKQTNKQEETHQWGVRHQYQFFYDQSLDQLHLDEGQFEICTLQLICSIEVCEQKNGKKSTNHIAQLRNVHFEENTLSQRSFYPLTWIFIINL